MNEHLTETDKVLAKTAGTLAEAAGQRRTTEIGNTIQAVRHMFETAANMGLCKPLSSDEFEVLNAFSARHRKPANDSQRPRMHSIADRRPLTNRNHNGRR